MKKLVKTKIGNCTVQNMPSFRSELTRMLFFNICSDANVYEAGIDNQKNIYFAYLNGNVCRYSRTDFLRLAKRSYVSVDFTLKNEKGNPEYLGPKKYLNYVSYCQIFQLGNDTLEKEDNIETGYVFEKNIGHWTGMNWTGKRFLVNRDYLRSDLIEENNYQSIQVWDND